MDLELISVLISVLSLACSVFAVVKVVQINRTVSGVNQEVSGNGNTLSAHDVGNLR